MIFYPAPAITYINISLLQMHEFDSKTEFGSPIRIPVHATGYVQISHLLLLLLNSYSYSTLIDGYALPFPYSLK